MTRQRMKRLFLAVACAVVSACGAKTTVDLDGGGGGGGGGGGSEETGSGAGGGENTGGGSATGGGTGGGSGEPLDAGPGPTLGGCPVLPANNIFNTRIDGLPVHANSAAFITTIGGAARVHLDLGRETDQTASDFYGIPFNLVHGAAMPWPRVFFRTSDPDMTWDARSESDCAVGSSRQLVSPCTTAAAPEPVLPIPATPLVEGGIVTDPSHPYGDHHILLLDVDSCRLWETYHSYPAANGAWDIYGAAHFDLRSNALRPSGWTSADAAGFPILPLLARADEALAGEVKHALRFTIPSNKIRRAFTWPARHLTSNGTNSMSLPPMGQLFRLKSTFTIPATARPQARALILALQRYGMYLADGGSAMYIQGDPSASWESQTFSVLQAIPASEFEAVDLTPITQRAGFDVNSGAVPSP
ncbi:MAG: hypothetical protein JNG84_14895 [Archangium sp.]|nr:hypothetical protein [Archangium sp.]